MLMHLLQGSSCARACLALDDLSPFNSAVLTVPAGQVAEEAALEDRDYAEEEDQPVAKKQKVEQNAYDLGEDKVEIPTPNFDCCRLLCVPMLGFCSAGAISE